MSKCLSIDNGFVFVAPNAVGHNTQGYEKLCLVHSKQKLKPRAFIEEAMP
jgi:hypothetical protein